MAKKAIARTVGVDVKTVRRYIRVAVEQAIAPPLDDVKLGAVLAALRAESERQHGNAWKACEAQRELIKQRLTEGVRLTKVRKLLERNKVFVPYATLHRFAVKELEFGVAGSTSVRLVDPPPGRELQMDTGLVVTLTIAGQEIRKKAFRSVQPFASR